MEEFLNQKLEFDDLFDHLKQMQGYLLDIKKLELFNLPKPVCLQNAYMLNMHSINNRWLDIFPSLKAVEKFIQAGKKLFFLPELDYYYYLYYHLLVAYKEFEDSSIEIYDGDETALDYDGISHYLLKKNLNATEFFKLYLKEGIYLGKEGIKRLEKANDVTDELDEIIRHQMSSEPTAPMFESETELELPKITSPLSSSLEVEVDLENYPEEKKVAAEK